MLLISTSIVVDKERAGIIDRTKKFRGDRGKHDVLVFIIILIEFNNFLEEGTINNGVVVEVAGKGDNIPVKEVGVNCGRTRIRGEVSSIHTNSGVHRRFVEVSDLGSNGTAPFLSGGGIILLSLIKHLHELMHSKVSIHQKVVGAIGGTSGDNC